MDKLTSLFLKCFPVGTFLKVPIFIHWSLIYIMIAYGVVGYIQGNLSVALGQIMVAIGIYSCVFLHEFGHILMARHYGIETSRVIMFMFGGVAAMKEIPRGKMKEFNISICGPLVNAILIAIFYFLSVVFSITLGYSPKFFNLMITINTWIFAFNLIPAYPMDGGRILRSLLSLKIEFLKATRIAMFVGDVFSIMFIFAAFYLKNPMWVIMAIFLFMGSRGEYNSLSKNK